MTETKEESSPGAHARGILSEADREFLAGERELGAGSERNARQRIRRRIRAGIADLELLWQLLPERDLEQVFHPEDESEQKQLRSETQHALAFLFLGLWVNRDPHPDRIEDAIEQSALARGKLANADVNLEVEPAPEGDMLLAKMQHQQERIDDLSERIEQGDLGEQSEAELREELQRESAFQYYLFEKGLTDPSVDAEKFASSTLLGAEMELSADEVEQSQQAWEEFPIVRRSLPAIVDISPEFDESASE